MLFILLSTLAYISLFSIRSVMYSRDRYSIFVQKELFCEWIDMKICNFIFAPYSLKLSVNCLSLRSASMKAYGPIAC